MVPSYHFLISVNALHAFLQIFDLPDSPPGFDETLLASTCRRPNWTRSAPLFATQRSTRGFVRHHYIAHIEESEITKWAFNLIGEGDDVKWMECLDGTHEGAASLRMALRLAAGRDMDLSTLSQCEFQTMLRDVLQVQGRIVDIGNALEVVILRRMNLSPQTANGQEPKFENRDL